MSELLNGVYEFYQTKPLGYGAFGTVFKGQDLRN